MKSPDNVLLGIAIFLLAGVILYNVFTVKSDVSSVTETTKITTVNKTEETTLETTVFVSDTLAKININTATEEELETLSGIGPAKASAIVTYREEHGDFSSVNDLINVSGIGDKTLAKIIDQITT
ncbi:MAG: helix-hairpin-helix domain-containing protein [Oscillospiraceae bacterium]|nr:helix-hairpin-helix domain-containing protein [Candidatus Limimonas coprohippi]MCQ2488245.1 helix-hairpin-helix domain-containing protein [Clostridia bacterium]